MEHSMYSVLGPAGWVERIAKRTSETSFSVHSLKRDGRVISLIQPSRYPEKIWSLLFSLHLGNEVLVKVDNIDRYLGEVVIALTLMDKRQGRVTLGPEVDRRHFEKIAEGTPLQDYTDFDGDPAILRESLLTEPVVDEGSSPLVLLDQAFSVRGVGTVALGFVVKGTLKKHMELVAMPGERRVQIRSIQVQDKDRDTASSGARVGIALRGPSVEDLPRGTALVDDDSLGTASNRVVVDLGTHNLWKGGLSIGDRLHIWHSLQFVPAEVIDVSRTGDNRFETTLSTESPIWYEKGDLAGLSFLDSSSFRFFCAGRIEGPPE